MQKNANQSAGHLRVSCACQTWIIPRPLCSRACDLLPQNAHTALQSMTSFVGTAQNLAWPFAGPWSCAIAMNLEPVGSPPQPSICAWRLCGGSHMKRPIMVC